MRGADDRTSAGSVAVRWLRDPVLATVLILFSLLVAVFIRAPLTPSRQLGLFWSLQPLLDVVMFVCSRRVVWVAGSNAPLARFWRWLARAAMMFAVGDVAEGWTAWFRPEHSRLGGGPAHAIMVAGGVFMVIVVGLTHPSEVTGPARRRLWLDAGTVMIGAATFVWYVDAGKISTEASSVAVVVILVSVFGLVKLALSSRPPVTRATTLVGVTGVGLTGVAGALIPMSASSNHRGIVLSLTLLPAIAIACAPRVQELQMRADPGVMVRPRRPYSLLPYVAAGASEVLLVLVAADHNWSVRSWGVVIGNIAVTSFVVLRQLAAFRENAALLGRLDASMLTLRRHERRFRSLVQHSSDITLIISARGTITYASPAVQSVLGMAAEDAEGRSAHDLLDLTPDDPTPDEPATGAAPPFASIAPGSVTQHVRSRHLDGSVRWLEVTITNLVNDPSIQGLVCNARDVTEAHELHERLLHQASHDALTQLANRAAFDQELARAQGAMTEAAILMIDLNGFKPINDTYGHHVGDEVLIQVASRIRRCVRPEDTVARLAGDEFAVLLRGATERQAVLVAERITTALGESVPARDQQLRVTASVGIAAGLAAELGALLQHADAAMYVAKRSGTASYHCAPTAA